MQWNGADEGGIADAIGDVWHDVSSGPIGGLGRKVVESRRQKKEEKERAAQAEAERHARIRQAAFEVASASCPLPISLDEVELPGDLRLFDDEFVVVVARDSGSFGIAILRKLLVEVAGVAPTEKA